MSEHQNTKDFNEFFKEINFTKVRNNWIDIIINNYEKWTNNYYNSKKDTLPDFDKLDIKIDWLSKYYITQCALFGKLYKFNLKRKNIADEMKKLFEKKNINIPDGMFLFLNNSDMKKNEDEYIDNLLIIYQKNYNTNDILIQEKFIIPTIKEYERIRVCSPTMFLDSRISSPILFNKDTSRKEEKNNFIFKISSFDSINIDTFLESNSDDEDNINKSDDNFSGLPILEDYNMNLISKLIKLVEFEKDCEDKINECINTIKYLNNNFCSCILYSVDDKNVLLIKKILNIIDKNSILLNLLKNQINNQELIYDISIDTPNIRKIINILVN